MRRITRTSRFKRDSRKVAAGPYGKLLDTVALEIIQLLAADRPMPEKYRDHALTGDWIDHRDCHLKPDLILIYRKPDDDTLELVRLGSHSELNL